MAQAFRAGALININKVRCTTDPADSLDPGLKSSDNVNRFSAVRKLYASHMKQYLPMPHMPQYSKYPVLQTMQPSTVSCTSPEPNIMTRKETGNPKDALVG